MIFIVIGQSGSGKTTFAKERFLNGDLELYEDIIWCTRCGNLVALGKYGIGIRTEGTDTLAYNAKEKIKRQIKKLVEEERDVLIEGDRIDNRAIFDYVSVLGTEVKLYLIICSLGTSMRRLRKADSGITSTFVKATKTKARNMFLEYSGRFSGEIIKTD